MPFNINEFNSRIAKSGIGRTNYYEGFVLTGPRSTSLALYGTVDMPYRIESLNLPGRNILTFEQRYHGIPRQLPYLGSYQPCTMTIILSQDYRERELFMRWQDVALGHYRKLTNGAQYPGMFDTRYYDEIIGRVQIKVYSNPTPNNPSNASRDFSNYNVPTNSSSTSPVLQPLPNTSGGTTQPAALRNRYQTQYTITLEEAYPISVNDVAMSWGDEGYARLTVEMRYRYATEEHTNYRDAAALQRDRNSRISNIN